MFRCMENYWRISAEDLPFTKVCNCRNFKRIITNKKAYEIVVHEEANLLDLRK